MSEENLPVLVVDSNTERARRFASFVQFLGYSTHSVEGLDDCAAAVDELPAVLAVFVAADAGARVVEPVLKMASARLPGSACFLIAGGAPAGDPPAKFEGRVRGVVSPGASYKELLGRLHEAELFYRHRAGGRGESSLLLYQNLVGSSDDINGVRQLVRQVAGTEASVLITGESGTGKEVVARCIHALSARRDRPFVPINCGAIPAELLESELFGHEKGAFTGAISSRQGRFEIAEGGTLFLDEIGDMPLEMQVKLLRVLQESTFERVGSHKTQQADVRIVAATHRDLEQLVSEGSFRMDLLYRLNVFPIEISPLCERAGDIPLLIDGFVNKLAREQRGVLRLSDCAVASLARYHWPGNVRELFNVLERLSILFPDKLVKWSDLPAKFRSNLELFAEQGDEPVCQVLSSVRSGVIDLPREGIDLKPHLADIERTLMTQALMQSEWVVARAAKLLNLQRTTLVEKMRKFEIQRPEELTAS
ncbi:MAG: sigma-54 dependent transcriptional regulator [Gammaproteobacteria bacterium]|nr:sigma-54 dependent transcriptional regulator [Gammaproteobacteria bacterium]